MNDKEAELDMEKVAMQEELRNDFQFKVETLKANLHAAHRQIACHSKGVQASINVHQLWREHVQKRVLPHLPPPQRKLMEEAWETRCDRAKMKKLLKRVAAQEKVAADGRRIKQGEEEEEEKMVINLTFSESSEDEEE